MKRVAIVLLLAALIAAIAVAFGGTAGTEETENYLRIHIRANSDSAEDQTVKYAVRDAVVAYLTPVVAECGSKGESMAKIGELLPEIGMEAEKTLGEHGFLYGAKAFLRREKFPVRVYEKATLPAGEYDALILELGAAAGDNWWCVVYPPLCFSSGNGNIVYKSKIAEIVRRFFG